MFNSTIISNMPVIGWGICIAISIICIVAVMAIVFANKFYGNLTYDLQNVDEENSFESKELNKIYEEFKNSVIKGTENVNTEVIIEKNTSKVIAIEKLIKYSLTLVILLGILGTFIGLTATLSSTFGQSFSADNIGEILNGMSGNMGTAFITSIFGMGTSIILNVLSIATYEKSKTNFYNELEHYLDNIVYSNHSNSFYNQFESMKEVFQSTMDNMSTKVVSSMEAMTENVGRIFEEGIVVLTEKINGVSLDLSKSSLILERTVTSMDKAIEKLNDSANRFSEPIDKFKISVDDFKVFYEGFDKQIVELDRIMNQVLSGFLKVSRSFEKNNEANVEMSQNLKENSERLLITYKYVSEIIDDFRSNVKVSQEVLDNNTTEFNNILVRLMDLINTLQKELKSMAKDTSDAMSKAMVEKVVLIEDTVKDSVSDSVWHVNQAVVNINDTLNLFRKSINAQNKWIEQMDDMATLRAQIAATKDINE